MSGSERIFNAVDMLEMWIQSGVSARESRHTSRVSCVRSELVRRLSSIPKFSQTRAQVSITSGVRCR
jgi:hypothetical protein